MAIGSLELNYKVFQEGATDGQTLDYLGMPGVFKAEDFRPQDFALSELATQLRYRYRFAPLSDFYLAYVLNGTDVRLPGEGKGQVLDDMLDNPNDNLLVAKLRFMF